MAAASYVDGHCRNATGCVSDEDYPGLFGVLYEVSCARHVRPSFRSPVTLCQELSHLLDFHEIL